MREVLPMPEARDGRIWRYVPRGRIHPMHHHDELELNLVLRGRGRYLLGDRRYDLARHSLVWLFSRQDHILLDTTPDFACWIIVWKPEAVRRACTEPGTRVLFDPNPAGHFCRRLSAERVEALDKLHAEIVNAEPDGPRFNYGLGYALLAAWAAFEEAERLPAGLDVHPAVERAAVLLREREGDADLEELAAEAGLSFPRLSRLFKQQMGVALAQFRNQQRVERFLRVYGTGQRRNMLDAALEAGFGSYPQFHRVFKALMGRSPAAYRRGLKSD
ncbi:MAG: helix-turn-helix transcriptional regulator [Planctomycetota bacterium]|nr:helix-turn-helix transcriptional regulator [Planctomycetota bacterium]